MEKVKTQKITITLKNDVTYNIELKDGQYYSINSEHQTFEVFGYRCRTILFMSEVVAIVTDEIKFVN